ncbi:MAG: aconitase X catalytic domain-containing protein [Rhodobacterales bacterium]|nr:aconitase X catalytic domain-containing protein [Rhodobacterales bacterium]
MAAMVDLTPDQRAALAPGAPPGRAMALRIVVEAARLLGAPSLVPIRSAHADGCIYHGPGGLKVVERLADLGARVAVPTTCNVGAIDLLHPEVARLSETEKALARRQMDGHVALGCTPSWTCAPYQAGHRPAPGDQVAWGESNAVAFVNAVLGARTNRYGDYLDVCCAIAGAAPFSGLHVTENRRATLRVDTAALSDGLKARAAFYPVLGAWLGRAAGADVAVFTGLPAAIPEDSLKALGAGAAATGEVGLFHIVGTTPEAPSLDAACQGQPPARHITLTPDMVRAARDALSTATGEALDCVAVGSPHYSAAQCRAVLALAGRERFRVPFHICTHRKVMDDLARDGADRALADKGVNLVVDTCVVVAPVLPPGGGVMMTDSAKFAHYGKGNTGHDALFGAVEDCVASAIAGRVVRHEAAWA